MRTKSAQVNAVIANPSHSARSIVTVYNVDGDVPTVLDEDSIGIGEPVIEVEVSHNIDGFRTARVTIQRQQGLRSLAPLVQTSNPLYDGVEPLIFVHRRIVIEAELQLPDISATPTGLRETIFDGWIDEIAWPDDDMLLVCTDQAAEPRDKWIERERVYGLAQGVNATKGLLIWSNSDYAYLPPLAVGDLVLPSEENQNGHFYLVSAAASPQLTTEPVWPTGSGSTVVSGGVTFTEVGATSATTGVALETLINQVLADNGIAMTVVVPISPGWQVKPYVQQRESVMDAIQAMVDQLGWYVRFEWDSGSSSYRLTLAQPDRTSVTVHKVLDEVEEDECSELGIAAWDVRNVVRVIYGDSSTLDPGGGPTRIVREVSDSASIAKYGRRFMEVAEEDGSNIDTSLEADRLANAILADLKEPTIGTSYSFPPDFYLELGDRITLPADTLRFTTAQTLAIQSLKHTFTADGARTSVTLRGAPAARMSGWLEMDGRVKAEDIHHVNQLNNTSPALATSSIVGGRRITHSGTKTKGALPRYVEHHVSTTASFTPSSLTLVASGDSEAVDVPDLVPGKTYYHRTIPYSRNASRIVRGEPSVERSFVAGRARAGHYDSLVSQGHYPLNGNFEHALDDLTSNPFDHWNITGGTWGSSGDMYWGTDAVYGQYLAIRQTGGDPGFRSNAFPVRRMGGHFNIYMSVRPQGTLTATRRLKVYVRFYRKSDLSDSPILFTHSVPHTVASANVWANYVIPSDFIGALPNDVNFCTIAFGKEDISSAYGWDVGDIFFSEAQEEDLWATTRAFIPTLYGSSTSLPPAIFQEAWTAFSYSNSFLDFDATSYTAGSYMKDAQGFVRIRGLVKRASAALSTTIAVLPAGYRPAKIKNFLIMAGGRAARLEIGTGGAIQVVSADDANWFTFFSLEGINFDTR